MYSVHLCTCIYLQYVCATDICIQSAVTQQNDVTFSCANYMYVVVYVSVCVFQHVHVCVLMTGHSVLHSFLSHCG